MSRGLQRERDLVNLLRKDGYWAIRSPASKGDVDVVAIRSSYREGPGGVLEVPEVRFIEVKSTSAGPWHSFGPRCREELSGAARLAGAEAWLVWWPLRSGPQWFHESTWPVDRSSTTV